MSPLQLNILNHRRWYFWTFSGLCGKQRTYSSQRVKSHKAQQYQLIRCPFNVFVEFSSGICNAHTRGCSFLLLYEAGVFAALRDLSPDILKSASRIYGASSGSIVATLGLCDCDIDVIKQSFFDTLKNSYWMCLIGGKILKILKDLLNKYLPPNAHQLVSGKLHVILTRVYDWRSVAVSEFASREDLIQAIMCSCFVPVCFGILPPTYHGVRYVDGELGMWRANFVSRTTITVSGFAGEYDICPRDGPAAFFTFQLSDCILQISKRNICRLQYIFHLPPRQVLDQIFIHGYQDTVSFFKRLSEFGINYLDEDFMFSLANESCQKGEGTLHCKPETRVLLYRATDPEDVTEENPGTIRAADEEEAPHLLLHHQKVRTQKSGEPSASRIPVCLIVTSRIQRSIWWSATFLSVLLFIFFLSLSTFQNLSA